MDVTVKKQWLGGSYDGKLTVQLIGTCGTASRTETIELSAADHWSGTKTGLPVYSRVEGKLTEWTWTLVEETPEGWKQTDLKTVDTVDQDGTLLRTYTLVNTRVTSISGRKYWQKPSSVPGSALPEITITLHIMKNGQEVTEGRRTQTINAGNGWTYEFEDLPTQDTDGTPYAYEVTEP